MQRQLRLIKSLPDVTGEHGIVQLAVGYRCGDLQLRFEVEVELCLIVYGVKGTIVLKKTISGYEPMDRFEATVPSSRAVDVCESDGSANVIEQSKAVQRAIRSPNISHATLAS